MENFKYSKIPEVKPEAEKEKTQEDFDAEIEKEANRLKTSAEELAQDINALGGEEKFKEMMESKKHWLKESRRSLDFKNEKEERTHFIENPYVNNPEKGSIPSLVVREADSPSGPLGERIRGRLENEEANASEHAKNMKRWTVALGVIATALNQIAEYSEQLGMTSIQEFIYKFQQNEMEGLNDYFIPTMTTIAGGAAIGTLVGFIKNKIRENRAYRQKGKHELRMKMTGVGENKNQS